MASVGEEGRLESRVGNFGHGEEVKRVREKERGVKCGREYVTRQSDERSGSGERFGGDSVETDDGEIGRDEHEGDSSGATDSVAIYAGNDENT